MLDEGQTVAYASDAGTPGISDPGAILAGLARKAGHKVIPIPGASAFASLASVAGAGGKTLIFEGFLSPKPGRRRSRLRELMATGDAIIIYESPFRIVKLLTDIADIEEGRRVVVGRELTKLHEEIKVILIELRIEEYIDSTFRSSFEAESCSGGLSLAILIQFFHMSPSSVKQFFHIPAFF